MLILDRFLIVYINKKQFIIIVLVIIDPILKPKEVKRKVKSIYENLTINKRINYFMKIIKILILFKRIIKLYIL